MKLRLILGFILLSQSYGADMTFPEDQLDDANEWLNRVYESNSSLTVQDRFGEKIQEPKSCVSLKKQKGLCFAKEMCLVSEPEVDPTTLFIPRGRTACTPSEVCCFKAATSTSDGITDKINVKGTGKGRKSCTTDKQEQGVCIKKSLCVNAVQTVDNTTKFHLRERDSCHYLEACCLEKNVREKTVKPIPKQNAGCGWSNPGANVFREKNSFTGFADYGEFPWMVALIKKGNENGFNESYAGGAVLIHPSVVMTAAHKVDAFKPDQIKIRVGEWDTLTDAEVEPYQERDVKKFVIHENHNEKQHNDIALLILKTPVDLSDAPHIGVACLASRLPPPGTRCFSMGWGIDFLNKNKYAVILKKIELPLFEASDCESRYKNTVLTSDYVLDDSLTCAGGEKGVDTCEGDGGSPLVCPIKGQPDRFEVVGLVVYGLECGTGGLPGVYLNVPHLYNWVGSHIQTEGFEKTFVY